MSPSKSTPDVKKLTKSDCRRYNRGHEERRLKFEKLVKYAWKIRHISEKYLPKNQNKE